MKQTKRLLSLALALILLLGTVSGSLLYAAAETTVLSNGNEVTRLPNGDTQIKITRFANGTYTSSTPYGVGPSAAKLCHAFVSVKAGDTVSMKLPEGYEGYVALGYDTGWTYTPLWLNERTETFEDDYRAMVVVRHYKDGKEVALEPAELADAEIVFTLKAPQAETETQEIVIGSDQIIDGGYSGTKFDNTTDTNMQRVRTQEMTFQTGDKISFDLPDGWNGYVLECKNWTNTTAWLNSGEWTCPEELSGVTACVVMKKGTSTLNPDNLTTDLAADSTAYIKYTRQVPKDVETEDPIETETQEIVVTEYIDGGYSGTSFNNTTSTNTKRVRTQEMLFRTGDKISYDLPDGWEGYVLECNSWDTAHEGWQTQFEWTCPESLSPVKACLVMKKGSDTLNPEDIEAAMAADSTAYIKYTRQVPKDAETFELGTYAGSSLSESKNKNRMRTITDVPVQAGDVVAFDLPDGWGGYVLFCHPNKTWDYTPKGAATVADWPNSYRYEFTEDTLCRIVVAKYDNKATTPDELHTAMAADPTSYVTYDLASLGGSEEEPAEPVVPGDVEIAAADFINGYYTESGLTSGDDAYLRHAPVDVQAGDSCEFTLPEGMVGAILRGYEFGAFGITEWANSGDWDFAEDTRAVLLVKKADGSDITPEELGETTVTYHKQNKDFDIAAEMLVIGVQDYYQEELEDTIAKVKALLAEDDNAIVFPLVTDIHYGSAGGAAGKTVENTVENMKKLEKELAVEGIVFPFSVNLGDVTDGNRTASDLANTDHVISRFNEMDAPQYFIFGNHDDGRYGDGAFSDQELYNYFTSKMDPEDVVYDDNVTYPTNFHKDFEEIGLRFIFMDSAINGAYGYKESTITWLEEMMDTTLDVVVFTHVSPVKYHNYNNTNTRNGDRVVEILKNADNFVGVFTGHNHCDRVFDENFSEFNLDPSLRGATILCNKFSNSNGNPDLWPEGATMAQRTLGTVTEDCFDVFVIRPDSKSIDMIRFGAGEDRHLSYCEHEELTAVPAKAATCIATGNVQYWKCSVEACGKLFADAEGTTETTLEAVTIAVDPDNHVGETKVVGAVDATTTSTGYTGDIYCGSCDAKLEDGEVIPVTPDDSPVEPVEPIEPIVPIAPIAPIAPAKPAAPTVSAPMTFRDVAKTDWYYSEVEKAFDAGLIDGMNENEFAPEKTLTVAQAIKLAAALHQLDKKGEVKLENGLTNWYSTYVDYAVVNDIVDDDYAKVGKDEMNEAITRAEFVNILHGALPYYNVINSVPDNAIPDVKMDHPHAAEIYEFYRAGILTGNDDIGTFKPDATIKRCEVAAILVRMFDSSARKSITLG